MASQPRARVLPRGTLAQNFRMSNHGGQDRQCPVLRSGCTGQLLSPKQDILSAELTNWNTPKDGNNLTLDALSVPLKGGGLP